MKQSKLIPRGLSERDASPGAPSGYYIRHVLRLPLRHLPQLSLGLPIPACEENMVRCLAILTVEQCLILGESHCIHP